MANLKSINQKSKEYVFKAYGNSKMETPAKVIFKRFPFSDEGYPTANQKSVLDSEIAKSFDNSQKSKEKLIQHIIDTMITNITAGRIDYIRFINECLDHIENLEYDNKEIKTIEDFINLPQEAFFTISQELYLYSKTEDKFSIEEKKI